MKQKKAAPLITLSVLFAICALVLHLPGSRATAYSDAQPATPLQKNETVYADTDATGKVDSIMVSVHLKTPPGAEKLADRSNLESITSITAGASPVIKGESVTWEAGSEDVYYQGASLNALPVGCAFSYTLDGMPINPDELAGKSGKVAIRAEFTNYDRRLRNINGSLEELFTPFTMISIIELPANIFSDVTVDNGRIIDQGETVMAAGFGLPGLSQSLDMENDALGISDTFTVTATVKDFALDSITTLTLPGILTTGDIGNLEPLGSLQNGLSELDRGGKRISSAAAAYSSGMDDFNGRLSLYLSGIGKLADRMSEVTGGISEAWGSTSDLHEGAQAVSDAINAATADTSGLEDARSQTGALSGLSSSLNDLSDLLAGLQPLNDALAALSPEELTALHIDPAMLPALQAATAVSPDLAASASGLQELATRLQASFDELAPLLDALPALGENTQDIADGLGLLSEGLRELEQGAAQLSDALEKQSSNGQKLGEGSQSLADNAATLASGMAQYSRGVYDFSRDVNGSIDDFNARKDAVLALGEAYCNFSLLPEGCAGSVRFVFTTQPVKSFE